MATRYVDGWLWKYSRRREAERKAREADPDRKRQRVRMAMRQLRSHRSIRRVYLHEVYNPFTPMRAMIR